MVGARPGLPIQGQWDEDLANSLVGLLREHTGSPTDIQYLVWEGWGAIPASWWQDEPRLRQPHRTYILLHGLLDDLARPLTGGDERPAGVVLGAAMSWPQTMDWICASEIDLLWTFVARPAILTDALLNSDLEVVPRLRPPARPCFVAMTVGPILMT